MSELPVRPDGDESCILTVRVTPKSSRDAVETVETDAAGRSYLKVRVRAVPENGAANKAVCALIAKWAGSAKSDVSLASGETSRVKQVRLERPAREIETLLRN